MKIKKILAIVFFVIGAYLANAQNNEDHDHDYHDHRTEIGMANAPVYFLKEKAWAYGLHFHAIRHLHESKLGLGIGYERIFDEHKHSTFGLVMAYRQTERLSFNLAPGLTWEGDETKPKFALHIESAYEFKIGSFHIGPVAEIAYDPEDIHLSIGLHIGLGF